MTAKVYGPLRKLTSVKADWVWNGMYHVLYDRAKKIVRKDVFMAFYYVCQHLYMETDPSGVSLEAGLLQVRNSMNCGYDEVPHNATLHPTALTSKAYLAVSGITTI